MFSHDGFTTGHLHSSSDLDLVVNIEPWRFSGISMSAYCFLPACGFRIHLGANSTLMAPSGWIQILRIDAVQPFIS